MHTARMFVLLAFLISPVSSGAQQTESRCPVAPAPSWTAQEAFVWSHVCIGQRADFDNTPGYGGKLDYRNAENWPQSRVLRLSFLTTILSKEPYRGAMTSLGIDIAGAHLVEPLTLQDLELQIPLYLDNVMIDGGVNFSRLRSKFPVAIYHSKINGRLRGDALDIGAPLLLEDSELDEVSLFGSHVGALNVRRSKGRELRMSGLRADQYVDMGEAEFQMVNLTSAQLGGSLLAYSATLGDMNLSNAHVNGPFDLSRSSVSQLECSNIETSLIIMTDARFAKSIYCPGAKVKGTLDLSNSTFGDDIVLAEADISGSLFLRSANWSNTSKLDLRDAKIANIPALDDSWPPTLDLQGFTYRTTGEFNKFSSGLPGLIIIRPNPMSNLPPS
jgi:uncharacterized protein YjbI with pentapeptide repeats